MPFDHVNFVGGGDVGSAPSPHFWMLVAGGAGVPVISLIHVTIVFIGEALLDQGYEPVTPL